MARLVFPLSDKDAKKLNVEHSSKVNKEALFPTRLRDLREKKGISQAKLAKEIGVTKSTIGLYETGDNVPDVKTVSRLAEFYGVSTDYLLCRTEFPGSNIDERGINEITGLSPEAIKALKNTKSLTPHLMSIISDFCNEWYLFKVSFDIHNYRELARSIKNIESSIDPNTQKIIPEIAVDLWRYKAVEKTSSNPLGVIRDNSVNAHVQHDINSNMKSALQFNNLEDLKILMASVIKERCLKLVDYVLCKEDADNAET